MCIMSSVAERIAYETIANSYSVPSGDSHKIAEDSLLINNGDFNYGPLDKPYGLRDDVGQKQDSVEKFKDFYNLINDRLVTKYNPTKKVA